MRISDWSSDVCSSDLVLHGERLAGDLHPPCLDLRQVEDVVDQRQELAAGRIDLLEVLRGIAVAFTGGNRVFVQHLAVARSEERRVGKERVSTSRFRWSPVH